MATAESNHCYGNLGLMESGSGVGWPCGPMNTSPMLRQLIIDFVIAVIKAGKWLVLVSIAISLSGCFKSDVALISEKQAIFPFEVITFQTDSTTGESATLVHEGGGYVVVAEPSFQLFSSFGNGSTFRLMPIEHGLYAVQEGIQAPYHYSVVEIDISGRSIREFGLNDLRRDGLKGLRSCDPKSPASTNASSDVCVDDIKSFVGYAKDAIDAGEKPSTEYAILSILPASASLRDGLAALRRGDYGTALSALRPLAEKGDAEALSALGTMYYAGKGVPKSNAIALKWYRLAAEQRNAAAENNLGVMYEKGEGVPADTAEAERWYGLAAAQGHDQAKRNLKDIRTNTTASERSETSDDTAAYMKQAQNSFLVADLVSALANWNGAIRLKPDDAAAHLSRANVFEMQGDLPSALEDYKAAALLFPKGDPNYDNAQSRIQVIEAELATKPGGQTSETLALSGNDRWVQIASRQDLNEAIDIAKVYTAFESRVVRAQNGWFAVVLGPYAVSDIDSFRRSYSGPALPPDTSLARGTGYVETVWLPSSDAVAESQPSPEIVTTSDGGGSLSSRPPADICRQALNTTSDDWDTKPQYADYVAEARRRGFSVDDCRGAIAQSESNQVLCVAALTLDKSNWDARDGYARYVIEAKRRNLTISDCRTAIGLPPLPPPLQEKPVIALCEGALTLRMDDWDQAAAYAAYVAEANRRNLSVNDCRNAVVRPVPNSQLCSLALNDERNNWGNEYRYAAYAAEAKRRNLSVDDCRVALGLPKLVVPVPKVAEKAQRPATTGGATIKTETIDENGQPATIISIEGELAAGDEARFADAALGAKGAIVMLSSPGGNLAAGIDIGRDIRLKGFATLVPEGFQCASACALAWLAGSPRFMGAGATVGFHAASSVDTGGVSSMGNAVAGAYLNQLGLPFSAVFYITEPQPDEIRWLTFEDAQQYGIEVRRFPPQ